MSDALTIGASGGGTTTSEQAASSGIPDVLRDIARGGIAGAIAGSVVGGLGGRLVMRLVAILHPDSVGALTENGNRIGDITLGGIAFLLLFGLIFGVLAGVVFVVVGPWVPGDSRIRAVLTAGLAITIGTPEMIIGRNPDFVILDHDPRVVALLVSLVGLIGLSIPPIDGWLDRQLPRAGTARRRPAVLYAAVALMGAVLVLPVVLLIFFTADEYQLPLRAGYALVVVGLCTATWWVLRVRGRPEPPRGLKFAARGALLIASVLGVMTTLPHIAGALGT
jgi:hypothetical protein